MITMITVAQMPSLHHHHNLLMVYLYKDNFFLSFSSRYMRPHDLIHYLLLDIIITGRMMLSDDGDVVSHLSWSFQFHHIFSFCHSAAATLILVYIIFDQVWLRDWLTIASVELRTEDWELDSSSSSNQRGESEWDVDYTHQPPDPPPACLLWGRRWDVMWGAKVRGLFSSSWTSDHKIVMERESNRIIIVMMWMMEMMNKECCYPTWGTFDADERMISCLDPSRNLLDCQLDEVWVTVDFVTGSSHHSPSFLIISRGCFLRSFDENLLQKYIHTPMWYTLERKILSLSLSLYPTIFWLSTMR